MRSDRALMFVGAHPDDESFGPGGTLTEYAAQGVRVVYACATRGEAGTADPALLNGYATLGDRRWAELMCAARALRLTSVRHLGYRDSGMPGDPDNQHPQALVGAPLEAVTRDIAAAIREVRPQVVITFDPIGGYYHPDHIVIHRATVHAFQLAADPAAPPDLGPPFAPCKLYYWIPSRRALRLAVRVLRIVGRDPRRFGRNADVDLARIADIDLPIHARVRVSRAAVARKHAAARCHRSQVDSTLTSRLARLVSECVGLTETYMRAHPRPDTARHEVDLFDGIR